MGKIHERLSELIANEEARSDLPPDEFKKEAEENVQRLLGDYTGAALKQLKRSARTMLRDRRAYEAARTKQILAHWRLPLDLIEMVCQIAEELGSGLNDEVQEFSAGTPDFVLRAVTESHAKAVLVAREAICLLKSGYPDGALSRWRTLHEVDVIALFIASHDQETAEKYIDSYWVREAKAAREFQEHAIHLGLEPIPDEQLRSIERLSQQSLEKWGNDLEHPWGWAAAVLGSPKKNWNLGALERQIGMTALRCMFTWACYHNHAGYQPSMALLGCAGIEEPVYLVGQSDCGFSDPIRLIADSLTRVTGTLTQLRADADRVVFMAAMAELSLEAADRAHELARLTMRDPSSQAQNDL